MLESKNFNMSLWQLLIKQAKDRKTLTYTDVSRILDYGTPRTIWKILYPIQYYCLENWYPPLFIMVVTKANSLPWTWAGKYSQKDVFEEELKNVYNYDWESLNII